MDERITTILKALAYGEVGAIGYMDDPDCLYCNYDEYTEVECEKGLHEPTCPIRLARAILKEQGTPLLLYRIEYEARKAQRYKKQEWYPVSATRLAFSEQEALQGYEDSPDLDDMSNNKRRNAQATVIREVL